MKIIDDYITIKKKHADFFKKFKPKQRIKHKNQIVSLKRKIDQIESQIINGLLSYRFNYSMVRIIFVTLNYLKTIVIKNSLNIFTIRKC